MKRISMILGLSLLLALAGCGSNDSPQTNNEPIARSTNTSIQGPASEATAPAASTDAPSPETIASSEEQVTETASEVAEAGTSSAQSLALRIAEMKPEPASQWKEGVHYSRLVPAQPTSAAPGQVEVAEVFWYGCPHCFGLDPYLENWRKNGKASYISFIRIPVMWSPGHQAHARVYYTAELLGKLEELHTPIFEEIHKNGNPLNSAQSIQNFFTSHGVSQAEFQKAFSSFSVESSLKRADALNLRYKVTSVPLIIINGKYVTDLNRVDASPQKLISLINDLASRERGT
ncbi:MAG: DsbA family protein [Steroidobacteraceae bacterium]